MVMWMVEQLSSRSLLVALSTDATRTHNASNLNSDLCRAEDYGTATGERTRPAQGFAGGVWEGSGGAEGDQGIGERTLRMDAESDRAINDYVSNRLTKGSCLIDATHSCDCGVHGDDKQRYLLAKCRGNGVERRVWHLHHTS